MKLLFMWKFLKKTIIMPILLGFHSLMKKVIFISNSTSLESPIFKEWAEDEKKERLFMMQNVLRFLAPSWDSFKWSQI